LSVIPAEAGSYEQHKMKGLYEAALPYTGTWYEEVPKRAIRRGIDVCRLLQKM
jgi:hypothetical protein